MKSSFIVVANRLPVSISKAEDGSLTIAASNGGLATAMASLEGKDAEGRLWIGWPGINKEDLVGDDEAVITKELAKLGCLPLFLTKEQVSGFYDGYCNATLWPLFHYFQTTATYDSEQWQQYRQVNELYAQAVQKYATKQATIWVHDYHFMLLPSMLRAELPDSLIGFFLHTPFPSFEIFRVLPERSALLRGLLGADLLGFHTYDYVRHFKHSVERLLGHKSHYNSIVLPPSQQRPGRTVQIDAFPIGINYDKFANAARSAGVKQQLDDLDKHYTKQRVILSVDRLDYSKGIDRRLEAFETFLQKYPKWHKKVALVMVAVPSRTDIASYQQLRDTIEQSVSRINGQYATVDWTPISYQFKNLPFEQVATLYAKADVALVTPLRDGMNLVAKEFVACKQERPGVLILSELTGAVDELAEALHINPNDREAVADTIQHALLMPKEAQWRRLKSMQQWLARYNVARWAGDFMEQLQTAGRRREQDAKAAKTLTASQRKKLVGAFAKAQHRSIYLDYDGTLMDYVDSPDPAHAAPSAELLQTLDKLASLPHTKVTIISGRSREALEGWFGSRKTHKLRLVAEHGAWIRHNGEWTQQPVSLKPYRKEIRDIMDRYADRTPGAVVEEKSMALVWHYRNVPSDLAYARTTSMRSELAALLEGSDIGVFNGRYIVDVRPRGVTKGTAIAELVASAKHPADFVLCMGDDYTDEAMFASLADLAGFDDEASSGIYSVRVGSLDGQTTRARHGVDSVETAVGLLEDLTKS